MNKTEFIAELAKDGTFEGNKAAAGRALEAMLDLVQKRLKKNDPVQLMGFGTFSVKSRKARTGRNPQTGAKMKIKARKVPHFKASKKWKV